MCAASEGRLRMGSGERGRGLGRAGGKGAAGLMRVEEGEDRDEKGVGSVSPGRSLRLVPGTAPGVSSALPALCWDQGLPAQGPAMEHAAGGRRCGLRAQGALGWVWARCQPPRPGVRSRDEDLSWSFWKARRCGVFRVWSVWSARGPSLNISVTPSYLLPPGMCCGPAECVPQESRCGLNLVGQILEPCSESQVSHRGTG